MEEINIVYPPNDLVGDNRKSLFLAGTIEMGDSLDWQKELLEELHYFPITAYNPRRLDWDKSWKQELTDEKFVAQVFWELKYIKAVDLVCVNFLPGSKSPISMMELGMLAEQPTKAIVCCPDVFWRHGNVLAFCKKFGIPCHEDYEVFKRELKLKIKSIL